MKYFLLIISLMSALLSMAQQRDPFNHPVCDTKVHDSGYYMRNADAFLASRRMANANFAAPYTVRVFIRIVRESNGTLPGCTVAEALDNFTGMQGQYKEHNICFQLVGIDFVNDSYLNNFTNASLLDTDYPNYIRNNNLDVDGAVTIFVHYNYLNNNGSSGRAYGIPASFLSVARWAATSTGVHSIFGHEMGHCLGLYHTFERINEKENVTRSSSNSCYNCNVAGDLCCDTPADFENSQDLTSTPSCNYFGNTKDACDVEYRPDTHNIMSYQPWECILWLTDDQRTRMHATILDDNGPIFNRVAEDNLVLTTISASSAVVRVYSAKNFVTVNSGATVSQTGSSNAYYAAGNSIIFSSGITFSPGSGGQVTASISGCN